MKITNLTTNSQNNINFGYISRNASKRIRKGYEEQDLPKEIKDLRKYFSVDRDYILDYNPETSEFVIYSTDYYRANSLPDYYIDSKSKKRLGDVPINKLLNVLINIMDGMKMQDYKGENAVKREKKLTISEFYRMKKN